MAHEWMDSAACLDTDSELFHPVGSGGPAREQVAYAKENYCEPCGVRSECLSFAMRNFISDGAWGGTTPKEREALRRRAARVRAKSEPERTVPKQSKPPGKVDAAPARRLLADSGMSFGAAARKTGVDKDSLAKIARGERVVILSTTWERIREGLAEVSS